MFKFLKDIFGSSPAVEGEKHPLDGATKKAIIAEPTPAPVVGSTWPFPTGEEAKPKAKTTAKPKAQAAKPAKPKAKPSPKPASTKANTGKGPRKKK